MVPLQEEFLTSINELPDLTNFQSRMTTSILDLYNEHDVKNPICSKTTSEPSVNALLETIFAIIRLSDLISSMVAVGRKSSFINTNLFSRYAMSFRYPLMSLSTVAVLKSVLMNKLFADEAMNFHSKHI